MFLPLTERTPRTRTQWPLLKQFQADQKAAASERRVEVYRERIDPVALATIEVVVDFEQEPTPSDSFVVEAALLLRVWAERGYLYGRSGGYVAQALQDRWWPESHAARYPGRGLALLVVIDALAALHGVRVFCDQLDTETGQYVRGRLHRAL